MAPFLWLLAIPAGMMLAIHIMDRVRRRRRLKKELPEADAARVLKAYNDKFYPKD